MRPKDYQEALAETGLGLTEKETLSPTAWAEEYLLMGLRIEEGISLARFEEISGRALPRDVMQDLVQNDLLSREGDRLSATEHGRLLLNTVIEKFLLS